MAIGLACLTILFTISAGIIGAQLHFLGYKNFKHISDIAVAEVSAIQIRRYEKDFLSNDVTGEGCTEFYNEGKCHSLTKWKKSFRKIIVALDNDLVFERLYGDDESVQNIQQIKSLTLQYKASFDKMTELHRKMGTANYGLVGQFRDAAHQLEKFVANDHEQLSLLLQSRRREKDFLLRHRQAYADKLFAHCEALKEIVAPSLRPLIDTYSNTFRQVVDIQKEIGFTRDVGLAQETRDAIFQVESLLAIVTESADADFFASAQRIWRFGLILSVASIVLSIIFSRFLVKRITDPLRTLVMAVRDARYGDKFAHASIGGSRELEELGDEYNDMVESRFLAEDKLLQALAKVECQRFALNSHAIVAVTDLQGNITEVNDKFCEISQYSRDELIGNGHQIIKSDYHPASFFKDMWSTISSGNVWHGEICNRAKDGSLYWVNSSIIPYIDAEGRIEQYIAIREDITKRKQVEEALKCALVAANAANQSKNDFLANMSHEIRTPMTAILGYTDVLLENGSLANASPERIDAINTIQRNGRYLLGIINDILDLSKIEAGKMTVENREYHPCQVLSDVASLMRVRADEKKLLFETDFIGDIPETIQTDITRLRQILINLVGNAIKFTTKGSVRLVTQFVDTDGIPYMQFDVIDTGRGIGDEQKESIFKPFTQADNSTTRVFGGTGLGLTICQRFAKLLGGDVVVQTSELGTGTVMRATITTGPMNGINMLDDPKAAMLKLPTAVVEVKFSSSSLEGCRILLVDDGEDNRRLISFILGKTGADVSVRENGLEAYNAATEALQEGNPFDVILMDMQMPVLDGYEATTRLRLDGYQGPVIAITAHAMVGDKEKCINAGCDDYTTKPIHRAKLIALIQQYWVQESATLATT